VHVKERAKKFVDKVVERYYKEENIILWNVWNEPRNRPIEECFCQHCRTAFGGYLKEKFGTIEALNKFYGATEESFENVNLPAMAHGYWDI
jgi:beta-galactosidase